ncbi:MAG TPA: hypothetical protein VFM45_08670, partial [Anaeromyxobacteraceae bacterium]|nr:hypothetical protein [Anaeromyxobacteraceae bacterium]
MGARTGSGIAALWLAVLLPARAAAVTVTEPIARLSVEGGYDSNALFLGQGSDRTGRISPELGLRLHDHLWDLKAVYGGDYLVYQRLQPNGIWNHRGELRLDATPTQRTAVALQAKGGYALDPIGLAQMGIFRTGKTS